MDNHFRLENYDQELQAWDTLKGQFKTQADAENAGRRYSVRFQETVRVLLVEVPTRKVRVVAEI